MKYSSYLKIKIYQIPNFEIRLGFLNSTILKALFESSETSSISLIRGNLCIISMS